MTEERGNSLDLINNQTVMFNTFTTLNRSRIPIQRKLIKVRYYSTKNESDNNIAGVLNK